VLRPGELAGLAKRPTAGVWHEDQPDLGVPITLNGIRGVIDPALLNGTFALKPLIRFRSGLKATLFCGDGFVHQSGAVRFPTRHQVSEPDLRGHARS